MLQFDQPAYPVFTAIGYLLSYALFTTILYFAITVLHDPWPLWRVITLTAVVAASGRALSWWLG